MTTYGWVVKGPDGEISTSGYATQQEALRETVRAARLLGWSPPPWWKFWEPKWPKEAAEEYKRQQMSA